MYVFLYVHTFLYVNYKKMYQLRITEIRNYGEQWRQFLE